MQEQNLHFIAVNCSGPDGAVTIIQSIVLKTLILFEKLRLKVKGRIRELCVHLCIL